MTKPYPRIRSTFKVGQSVAGHVLRGAAGVAGQTAGAVVARIPRRRPSTAPAPAPAPPPPPDSRGASSAAAPAESVSEQPEPGVRVTPADVARNVAPKPKAKKKPAKKSSPSAKLPPPRRQAEDGAGGTAPNQTVAKRATSKAATSSRG